MGHKVLARMKAIVNKDQKVDMDTLLERELDEFWADLWDYVQKNNNTKDSGILKRRKFVNWKVTIEALALISRKVKADQIHAPAIPNMVKVFGSILHPDSPVPCQKGALKTVLKFLKIMPSDDPHVNSLMKVLTPLVKLARKGDLDAAPPEKWALEDIQALVDKGGKGPEMTKEDVVEQLKTVLAFAEINWRKNENLAVAILRNELPVIYHDVAKDAGIAPSCGYVGIVPTEIHAAVFEFIKKFLQEGLDWKPVFADKDFGKFMVLLMQHAAQYPITECCSTALHVLSDICKRRDVIGEILKKTPDLISSFIGSVGTILFISLVNHKLPPEIASATCEFIGAFFPALFQERQLTDMLDMMEKAFDQYKSHSLVLSVFYIGFVAAVFGRQDENSATWDFIVKCATNYDDIAAANGKYAEYLMLLLFPQLLGIDVDAAVKECEKLNDKRGRTRQVSPSDWFCDNLKNIVSDPHTFACSTLTLDWGKPIDYPVIIPKRDQDFVPTSMIEHFLQVFESYKKAKDIAERRRMFSAFYGTYRTLLKVMVVPSSIKHDRNAAFVFSANRLFNGIFHECDSLIQYECFDMLSEFILHAHLKPLLSEKILSEWYAAICICLFSKEKKLSELALTTGIKTVQIGFVGSGMLLPVLLNYTEKVLKLEAVPLIASVALFASDTSMPDAVKATIKAMINEEKDLYVDFVTDVLDSSTTSLRERAQKLVVPLCQLTKETEGADKKIVLPMLSAVIVDEMTQDKPDVRIVCFLMTTMAELIELKVWETVSVLKNLIITFSDRLRKEAEFTEVVKKILELSPPGNPGAQVLLHLMQLKYETIIHHPDVAESGLKRFVQGVTKIAKAKNLGNELRNQAVAIVADLAVRFKNYPYPNSPLFIRNVCPFNRDGRLCAFRRKAVVLSIDKDEEDNTYVIDSEVMSGHFKWKFSSVPHLTERKSCDEFTFPGTLTESSTSCDTLFEKTFSEKWAAVLDDMGDKISFNLNIDKQKEFDAGVEASREIFENNHGALRPPPCRTPESHYVASAAAVCPLISGNEDLAIVKRGEQVDLKVKEFDDYEYRAHSKIAILYVPDHVFDQNDILAKTLPETSPHFSEFLHAVGSPVDLATHRLYAGGLDRKGFTNGNSSVYYADSAHDVMFHVSPLMPTSSTDAQQILKKRHVGNDPVHIVWNDNLCEYDVQTISSQFNEAHIIIYPLQTGLFRIDVKSKQECGWFGPLRDTTIVTKRMLPSLVRLCAISANVAVTEKKVPLSVPSWQSIAQLYDVWKARDEQSALEPLMEIQLPIKPT